MGASVTITVGDVSVTAELNDSRSARAIGEALPLSGSVSTWGEEIYFPIPLELPAEDDARAQMEVGELAYWPDGRAVCVFFGPTPASEPGGAPRAVGPVNPVGRVTGAASALRSVNDGDDIVIKRAD
ncbi:MAG: cyclophilin-like fold protein [Phycisphaerae bacterium]